MSTTVVVTGAAGPLGRRVCALIAADPGVDRVVGIDQPGQDVAPGGTSGSPAAVEMHLADLSDPDLRRWCEGAAAVVHLGPSEPLATAGDRALDGTGSTGTDLRGTRALLAAASDAGVSTLVVLSSAIAYGAWPNNPIPLTEDAPLRPDPDLAFAVEKAELERLAFDWQLNQDAVEATVAVLRPTVAVAAQSRSWLARSPWSATGMQVSDAEPPVQFVHLDDVAAAVDLARRGRLDGVFNVAPDGWIPAEQLRALSGPAPRIHLPAAVAERVASFRWSFGFTATPPSVLAYRMYPWVVANDRLRAAGWEPQHTNEEAFVEADDGGPLGGLDARRKQLLSLGAVGVAVAAAALGAVALVRRTRRA